jgi:predicted metal-dependent HD superfamily phosphohydrolase
MARRRGSASAVTVVGFRDTNPAEVVAKMRALAQVHQGWVNLQPGIHPDDVPSSPGGIGNLFAASMPSFQVPVTTWVPGRVRRNGAAPDSIGIQHGTGPRVVGRLTAAGVPIPQGWRWRQDHPRRGLVVEVPSGTDPAMVVAWLVDAAEVLALVPLTGDWRAEVHGPVEALADGAGVEGASGEATAPRAVAPDDSTLLGDLEQRWLALTQRWDGADAYGLALFRHLLSLYGGPRRAYHDAAHVRGVLDHLGRIALDPLDVFDDTGAVEMAAWFHDAVLDPLASDNEARSAELAQAELPRLGVSPDVVDEVDRLVRLTSTHRVEPGDRNAAALMDADLAGLGGTPEQYDRYRDAVRREYAAVSDGEFGPGRAAVLRSLLDGPIYRTHAMAGAEAGARANLMRELAGLEGG